MYYEGHGWLFASSPAPDQVLLEDIEEKLQCARMQNASFPGMGVYVLSWVRLQGKREMEYVEDKAWKLTKLQSFSQGRQKFISSDKQPELEGGWWLLTPLSNGPRTSPKAPKKTL